MQDSIADLIKTQKENIPQPPVFRAVPPKMEPVPPCAPLVPPENRGGAPRLVPTLLCLEIEDLNNWPTGPMGPMGPMG